MFDIKGESFAPGYPESLLRLASTLAETDGQGEAPAAIFVRAPSSKHPEAIEVHVPALGHRIGNLAKDEAERMCGDLDAGQVWNLWVTAVMPSKDGTIIGARVSGVPVEQ